MRRKPRQTVQDLEIPGYDSPYRRGRNANGGGIIVWVKTKLAGGELEDAEKDGHEMLWFTVKHNIGRHAIMCATYRPPSADDKSIADYFDRILPKLIQ